MILSMSLERTKVRKRARMAESLLSTGGRFRF